jgi:glucose/arabinose dehydrogenase
VFLPDDEKLLTERPGNLLKIGTDQKIINVEGVVHIGEGGLLGLALDPDYPENHLIYLYSTTSNQGQITNRVERYKLDNYSLSDRKVIVSGIKGSSNHDGGRIKFGPDNYLYITTGDAETPSLAQDKNSLNGKILRVDSDGNPAPDNPFGNAVYSMGHRNVQGIAWDSQGRLWATEHGPSGTQTGDDEINLIQKGGNYGWPVVKGAQTAPGMISPVLESGKDTWAPSGMIYYKNNLFFGGLRGEALYQAKIDSDNKLTLIVNFKKEFGRIRTVTLGPDGNFYILTNNTDGRGTPNPGDDKIIRINPDMFFK